MVFWFYRLRGVPILLFAGALPDLDDNQFIRWVYHKRHLSSISALRRRANVADVHLERKIWYEYAKLKERGQLRNRTRYTSATLVAAGSDHVLWSVPIPHTTIGEKSSRSMDDTCHDVKQHPRHMAILLKGYFIPP